MAAPLSDNLEDISPIPYFPYEPGLLEWGLLLLFIVAVTGIALVIMRRPRSKTTKALDFCMRELSQLERDISAPDTPTDQVVTNLSKAATLVKRLLSNLEDNNIASLSLRELRQLREHLGSESLRDIVEVLCALENSRFQPGVEQSSGARLITQLKSSLQSYREVTNLR